jgi:hypothetical protein
VSYPPHRRCVPRSIRRSVGGLAVCAVLAGTLVVLSVPANAKPAKSDEIPSDAYIASGSFQIGALPIRPGSTSPRSCRPKSRARPVSKEESRKKARENAFTTNTKSFYDTAKVPVDGQNATAASDVRPASLDSEASLASAISSQPTPTRRGRSRPPGTGRTAARRARPRT